MFSILRSRMGRNPMQMEEGSHVWKIVAIFALGLTAGVLFGGVINHETTTSAERTKFTTQSISTPIDTQWLCEVQVSDAQGNFEGFHYLYSSIDESGIYSCEHEDCQKQAKRITCLNYTYIFAALGDNGADLDE